MKKTFLLFSFVILLFGCGPTQQQIRKEQIEQLHQKLDKAIGNKTYDDSIIAFGPPTSVTSGDEIFIATWKQERTSTAFMPLGNNMAAFPISHGEELRLIFNKNTKILIKWHHRDW